MSKVFSEGTEHAVTALDNASLQILDNEFFTLLGPSGCGKTTLLRLIAGFEQPTRGEIRLAGDQIAHLPPHQRPVNTVFQSYALFPHMTVAENIGFGLQMLGKPKNEIESTVERMLSLVQLEGMARRRTSQLSGGQQQRVALARALANHPNVLLLDEPLSALDLKLRQKMRIELKTLQRETGITFVFVTHDQEEALTMSDRVAVMNEGSILQVGTPTDIYEHPTHRFIADFIGETNLLEVDVIRHEAGATRVRLASGAERTASAPKDFAASGNVTVAIRPERVNIAERAGDAALVGRVENIVYFGTDTIYHLDVNDSRQLTVRLQNRDGAQAPYAVGDEIAIEFPDKALQVLRD